MRRRRPGTAIAVLLAIAAASPADAQPAAATATATDRVVFTSDRDGDQEIFSMKPDGTDIVQLTDNAVLDQAAIWSPDGQRIAFMSQRDGNLELYRADASGSSVVRLTNDPGIDAGAAWSPDGTKIAFQSDRDGDFEIYVMNAADGSGLQQLTHNTALDAVPTWSPDGTKIVFESGRDGTTVIDSELYVMDPSGAGQTRLTFDNELNADPEFSPDGTKIVFEGYRGQPFTSDIYVMASSGGVQTQLTNDPGYDTDPSWSPDGTTLVFTSDRGGEDDLYLMPANGGTPLTNITNSPGLDAVPDWGLVGPCTSHPFTDVPMWVSGAVDWGYCNQYVAGFPNGTFRPNDNISRAQVARMLYRIAGEPDTSAMAPHGLSDVPPWVEEAVTWLVDGQYATGYPNGTFKPNDPITRGAVTRTLFRIAGSPPGSPLNTFSDTPSWVDPAVDWITDPANSPPHAAGYPNNTYRPDDPITRAQTTRMVCRINAPPGTC